MGLLSIDRSLRPDDSDDIVIAIDSNDGKAVLVAVGIQLVATDYEQHVITRDQGYDPEKLRLLRWRKIIEEQLCQACFDVPDEEGPLAITLTVLQCIKLAGACLTAAGEWDWDQTLSPSLCRVTEYADMYDDYLLKPMLRRQLRERMNSSTASDEQLSARRIWEDSDNRHPERHALKHSTLQSFQTQPKTEKPRLAGPYSASDLDFLDFLKEVL